MPHEPLSSASEGQTFALPALDTSIVEAGAEVTAPVERIEEDKQAAQAIARLGYYSIVRKPALGVLQGHALTTLAPLLAALKQPFSSYWREAQMAIWTLGRAPLTSQQKIEAATALTQLLQLPSPRIFLQKLKCTIWAMIAVTLIAFTTGISVMYINWNVPTTSGQVFNEVVGATFVCGLMLMGLALPVPYAIDCAWEKRRAQVRACAAQALGRLAMPNSVEVLSEVLQDAAPTVRDAAISALMSLLTPAHRGQLRPQVISAIYVDIEYKTEAEVLKRLDALEVIGDTSSLTTLKDMRHYGRTKAVRVRAAQVYSVLEERQAQENAPKMLLRASDASHVAPDVLLRAASGESVSEPSQLLRAANRAE